MHDSFSFSKFKEALRSLEVQAADFHVVLGSGYAAGLGEIGTPAGWTALGEIHFADIPGLSVASAPGHGASYRYFRHSKCGKVVCFQMGRLHGYEGLSPKQVARTVTLPFLTGTRNFILTNASGALTREFPVGSVLLIRDHVNFTGQNPLVGPNAISTEGAPLGPRFPDMTEVYDPEFRARLRERFRASGIVANEGVYLGVLGPSFETPAEVNLFGAWGLHAVGMSTVWEAIALRYLGARTAGVSLLANYGSGLAGHPLTAEEVLEIGLKAGRGILESMFAFFEAEFTARA